VTQDYLDKLLDNIYYLRGRQLYSAIGMLLSHNGITYFKREA